MCIADTCVSPSSVYQNLVLPNTQMVLAVSRNTLKGMDADEADLHIGRTTNTIFCLEMATTYINFEF